MSFPAGPPPVGLQDAISTEVGLPSLSAPLDPSKGWTASAWLVGHAADFKIAAVTFGGQRWAASTGTWAPDPAAALDVVGLNVSAAGVKS